MLSASERSERDTYRGNTIENRGCLFIYLFVYMFGRTYVIKRASGELLFSKKHGFLGLTPVYSENTALSKPYFILKAPKCEKISAKTLAFQETKS